MPGWTGPGQYFCRRGLSRSPSYLRLREPLPVPSWREKEQREAVGGFNSQAWNDAHHFCSLSRTRSDDHTSLQRSLAIAVQSHAQKKKKKMLQWTASRYLPPSSAAEFHLSTAETRILFLGSEFPGRGKVSKSRIIYTTW